MSLDPNVPPHKTKPFWYIVSLAVLFLVIIYPSEARSHEPLWLKIVPSLIASVMMICVGWFAVRRIQRDLVLGIQPSARPSRFSMFAVALALVFFVLSMLFKHWGAQKQVRPVEDKPDYIKKLEEWKP
jgi:peptidoglycan biosynthesis protein MviN/MurJ (putative lipid II flippase)